MRRTALALLPLLLTIALNPLLLCLVYLQAIPAELGENASVLVNGKESGVVKTDSRVTIKTLLFIPESTSFSVQLLPNSLLIIDDTVVKSSSIRLEAGERSIYLESTAPYVNFPHSEIFLNLQPITNVGRIEPLTITLVVYPKNWDTILQLLVFSGAVTVFAGAVSSFSNIRSMKESSARLKEEREQLRRALARTRRKVVSLIDLLGYVIDETGFSEERFLEELERHTAGFTSEEEEVGLIPSKQEKREPPSDRKEKGSPIKLLVSSSKLKEKLGRMFIEEE